MIETRPQKSRERALLIGLEKEGVSKWDLHDSLDELRELANSAGAQVVDTVNQKLSKPTAPYYIGRGKAELIKESCQDQQVTSVIFDDELSPAQGRNLENLFARKVLDRTQLILDIFAQRARSREGRLQSSWPSCNIFCRALPGCGITCHDRLGGLARAALVKRSWKWTVGGCRNRSRAPSASSRRSQKPPPCQSHTPHRIHLPSPPSSTTPTP